MHTKLRSPKNSDLFLPAIIFRRIPAPAIMPADASGPPKRPRGTSALSSSGGTRQNDKQNKRIKVDPNSNKIPHEPEASSIGSTSSAVADAAAAAPATGPDAAMAAFETLVQGIDADKSSVVADLSEIFQQALHEQWRTSGISSVDADIIELTCTSFAAFAKHYYASRRDSLAKFVATLKPSSDKEEPALTKIVEAIDPKQRLRRELDEVEKAKVSVLKKAKLSKWKSSVTEFAWLDPASAMDFVRENGHSADLAEFLHGLSALKYESFFPDLNIGGTGFYGSEERELERRKNALATLRELELKRAAIVDGGGMADESDVQLVNGTLIPQIVVFNMDLARKWVGDNKGSPALPWLEELAEDMGDVQGRKERMLQLTLGYFGMGDVTLGDYHAVCTRYSADEMRKVGRGSRRISGGTECGMGETQGWRFLQIAR